MTRLRAVFALLRAGWRTTTSYRVRFLFSMASVVVSTLPLFFIARAIQPMMKDSIAGEGGEYFGFLLLGFVVLVLIQVAGEALPNQVSGDIGNGFFEAMSASPVGMPAVLAGLSAYPLLFATLRGLLTLGLGSVLGIDMMWSQLPLAAMILTILLLAHLGVALVATAGVVLFRSSFAVPQLFSTGSALLGGAFWPTSVIPSWLQAISDFLPLTYGLRALRRVLLEGVPLSAVADDVVTLGASAGLLFVVGVATLSWAVGRARKVGSLSQY